MTPDKVKLHFNVAARDEWDRLDKDEYSRLIYRMHLNFIKSELAAKPRVLDAGCGSGRYSLEFARQGCAVTLCDISDGELEFAKGKFLENGASAEDYICADLRDLGTIPGESFDLTVCYGAPLSYITENREAAVRELIRVTKRGGTVAVSVNNTWGILRSAVGKIKTDFFANSGFWRIDEVVETGDCPSFESDVFGKTQAPEKHFFQPRELAALLEAGGLSDITLGAAPCLCSGSAAQYNALAEDSSAKAALEELELKCFCGEGMVGFGEFLLAKGTK